MPYVCNLSPELQKYAKDVLNEDPATRDEKIEDVRQWINKQPHLNARTDDWFILRFLRWTKFSIEKTKQKIDDHYTIRSMIPEWFKARDPNNKDMLDILKQGVILHLPKVDVNGMRVSISRNGLIDPEKYQMDDIMKALYMLIDVEMEEDEVISIMGMNFIMDLVGFSAAHMLAFTPTMTKKCIVLFQDGYPFNPRGIHYINLTPAFEKLFNICKSFFNEELKNKISMHTDDLTPLFKEVPQETLTKEYGGNEDTQSIIDNCVKLVQEKRDWILEQNKYGVDESKRPGKPKTAGDLFGIDESIKELNFD